MFTGGVPNTGTAIHIGNATTTNNSNCYSTIPDHKMSEYIQITIDRDQAYRLLYAIDDVKRGCADQEPWNNIKVAIDRGLRKNRNENGGTAW